MTTFSILVPTRERAATLRYTLESLIVQPQGGFEIVVADNCSSPATKLVVEDVASSASCTVKYVRSDTVLPMAENWEKGLAACEGDYVTVIGDDDGLSPVAIALARSAIDATKAKVLSWALHTYWWPDTIVYWQANRLFVNFGNEATWLNSRDILQRFYAGSVSFGTLPMIYNAFVSKETITRVRERYGRYFVSPDLAPDVTSGIVNLMFEDKFLYSTRPLGIRGNSGKSNGTAQWARHLGAAMRENYLRDEGTTLEKLLHGSLVHSPNLDLYIASIKLKIKEAFFPDDKTLNVNLADVVDEMVANLNNEPEAYEDNLADALALAKKLSITVPRRKIPSKQMRPRTLGSGPNGPGQMCIDCNRARVYTISAAAQLAESMMPPATGAQTN